MKYILVVFIICASLVSCKTSEANYRAAYEKTVAAKDAENADETIYGGSRRKPSQSFMMNGTDTVFVNVKMVSPLVSEGEEKPEMRKLMVVVGQFKQKFNALSLRDRVAANGYPEAFVVQTSEPYYYIVAQSFDDVSSALAALDEIRKKAPVVMKDPVPFILRDPRM